MLAFEALSNASLQEEADQKTDQAWLRWCAAQLSQKDMTKVVRSLQPSTGDRKVDQAESDKRAFLAKLRKLK